MDPSILPYSMIEKVRESEEHEREILKLIRDHQEKAAQLPIVAQIRTLLAYTSFGLLSCFSEECVGYPSGALVDFACNSHGHLIIAVNRLSAKKLSSNPKCSLLITKDPEDRNDLIVTVYGDAAFVSKEDKDAKPLATSLAADGDFQFFRIEPKLIHYVSSPTGLVSGVCRKDEYSKAKVDPIYQFSESIASHMNKDHEEDTRLIVQHYSSIPVDNALMLDVDCVGFNVKAGYKGKLFKLRIPFPRRANERKDVKTLIIEMFEAARQGTLQ